MPVEVPAIWTRRLRESCPNLQFEFASVVDFNYNCLSWAVGLNEFPLDIGKGARWFWPNIPNDTADGWAQVCQEHGFTRADNIDFKPGYEKIAIMVDEDGDLHATRSTREGVWKSKLGDWGPDIDHVGLEGLKPLYGEVVIALERRRHDWD